MTAPKTQAAKLYDLLVARAGADGIVSGLDRCAAMKATGCCSTRIADAVRKLIRHGSAERLEDKASDGVLPRLRLTGKPFLPPVVISRNPLAEGDPDRLLREYGIRVVARDVPSRTASCSSGPPAAPVSVPHLVFLNGEAA